MGLSPSQTVMIARKILTAGLLLFVAASLASWAIRELRPSPAGPAAGRDAPPAPPAASGKRTIAYYFHRTERCPTCNTMEAYCREAIAGGFGDALAKGRIAWRVVNYQAPADEHFRRDFDLIAPSLVLVATEAGRPVDFEELPDIWTLVDDKPAFLDYVRRKTAAFLETH